MTKETKRCRSSPGLTEEVEGTELELDPLRSPKSACIYLLG